VFIKKTHEQHQKYSYSFQQKNNKPLPGFPPSLRLKEPQTKPTSLIPTERVLWVLWVNNSEYSQSTGAKPILKES
jgi:hypothetical protein